MRVFLLLIFALALSLSQNCSLKTSDYGNDIKNTFDNGSSCSNLTILIDSPGPFLSSSRIYFTAVGNMRLELIGLPQKSLLKFPSAFSNFVSVKVQNLIVEAPGPIFQGLFFTASNATIDNCTFRHSYSGIFSNTFLSVSNSVFFNNTNGAISNLQTGSWIEVRSSQFTSNNSTFSGGAINAFNALLINNTFETNYSPLSGGAVNVQNQLISRKNVYKRNLVKLFGGAVNAFQANLEEDQFIANSASDGGAIYMADQGKISTIAFNISGCIFDSNTCTRYGGSIFALNPTMVVMSKFYNCTSKKGGAIYAIDYVAIYDSLFSDNKAIDDWGGAAFSLTMMDLYNTTFLNNRARGSGGALATVNATKILDCSFVNNRADFYGTDGYDLGGGAVYLALASNVSNTLFSYNFVSFSEGKGGALSCDNNCTITNCRFYNNTSGFNGGAYYGAPAVIHTMINCSFIDNFSLNGGGIRADHCIVQDSYFSRNYAQFGGGGFLAMESRIINSTFEDNTGYYGAAVYGNNVDAKGNSTFIRNVAKIGGGAILSSGIVEVTDCIFIENQAANGGAIQLSIGTSFGVFNSTFIGNKALLKGGFLGASGKNSIMIFYGLKTRSNSAGSSGGSLFVSGTFDLLIIDNWDAKDEISLGDGGSVNVNVVSPNSTIIVKNSTFEGNSSPLGGTFFVSGVISSLSFLSIFITNSTASLSSGGALVLRMNADSVKMQNVTLHSNSANYWGSCLIQHKNSVIKTWEMDGVNAYSNVALTGGGFTLQGTVLNFTVVNSLFENNRGVQGSAIEVEGIVSSFIQNSNFRNNSAQSGGSIFSSGSLNISIFESNFESNSAVGDGGALSFGNSTISYIERSSFSRNNAQSGGAIVLQLSSPSSVPVLFNNSFVSNKASNAGGAVRVTTTIPINSLFARNCNFEENLGGVGGAISISNTQRSKRQVSGIGLDDLSFVNNNATEGGGLESNGDLYITNSFFGGNSASKGSGLSVKNGTITVEDLSLENSQIFLSNAILVSSTLNSSTFSCGDLRHVESNNGSFSCVDDIIVLSSTSPILVYKDSNNLGLILGVTLGVGGFLLIVIIIVAILVYQKRQRAKLQANSFSHIDFSKIKLGEAKKSIIDFDTITVHKEIGAGAFGVVYKGEWRGLTVAVKQIKSEQVTQVQLDDFVHEVTIFKELRAHPNVVLFLGVTFPPQPLSLVTEFCEGGGLYDYLRKEPIDFARKLELIKGIARGMYHLHKEGVIHRDLAVRNILLSKHLEPKISDFGLSREHADTDTAATTNTAVGPLKWMAPEAILHRQYSIKSDAFSFGVVIWEILEVQEPWEGLSMVDAALRVAKEGARMPIPSSADDVLTGIIQGCWEQDPVIRYDFEKIISILEPPIDVESRIRSETKRNEGGGEPEYSTIITDKTEKPSEYFTMNDNRF